MGDNTPRLVIVEPLFSPRRIDGLNDAMARVIGICPSLLDDIRGIEELFDDGSAERIACIPFYFYKLLSTLRRPYRPPLFFRSSKIRRYIAWSDSMNRPPCNSLEVIFIL